MSASQTGFHRLLRISGILILLGLGIEAVSLRWVHPLAFIGFFVVGGALLGAGILLFLYSLVTFPSA